MHLNEASGLAALEDYQKSPDYMLYFSHSPHKVIAYRIQLYSASVCDTRDGKYQIRVVIILPV